MIWFSTVFTNIKPEDMSQMPAHYVPNIRIERDTTKRHVDELGKARAVAAIQERLVKYIGVLAAHNARQVTKQEEEVAEEGFRKLRTYSLDELSRVMQQLVGKRRLFRWFWVRQLLDYNSRHSKLMPMAEGSRPPLLSLAKGLRERTMDKLDGWFQDVVIGASESRELD